MQVHRMAFLNAIKKSRDLFARESKPTLHAETQPTNTRNQTFLWHDATALASDAAPS